MYDRFWYCKNRRRNWHKNFGGGSVSLNGQPIITAQNIDDELSNTSENLVQNKVIANKFAENDNKLFAMAGGAYITSETSYTERTTLITRSFTCTKDGNVLVIATISYKDTSGTSRMEFVVDDEIKHEFDTNVGAMQTVTVARVIKLTAGEHIFKVNLRPMNGTTTVCTYSSQTMQIAEL